MKQALLLLVFFFVSGCAANYPTHIQLNPMVSDQPLLYNSITASIQGNDNREHDEVVAYHLDQQMPILVSSTKAPQVLVTELLVDKLREQGLRFASQPNVFITLEVNELLATVSKPKLLYKVLAMSKISLKVVKDRNTLTKSYQRQTEDEFARRPEVGSLENMLNEQLSDIIKQILQDEDIRRAIKM